MTQSNNKTSSSGISDFLRDSCFGELNDFKKYALPQFPEYVVRNYDFLMPYNELVREMLRRYEKISTLFENYKDKHVELYKVYNSPENATPFTFTGALFVPAILMLGDDSQIKNWTDLAMNHRLVASYVQTEYTHGSDVQGITTEANFDFKKKCFVLNTPNIGATKIWGGASGSLASHIVTQAKLIIGEKNYGLQTFVTRVRDPKTHKPLPGLEIGDIGSKLGFKSVDNGFVRFNNFEVPLDGILRKYIDVDENGNVTLKGDKNSERLTYGAMMSLRSNLVSLYSFMTSKILNMIMEYKKNTDIPLLEKVQILDAVAENYNLIICCKHMRNEFAEFAKNYKENPKLAVKMIKDLHFTTCGLKVFTSQYLVSTGRDQSAKNSVGSLLLSGICSTYSESVPTVTYEGDSTVLLQQVSQVALLMYNQLKNGKEIKGIADFLNKYKQNASEDIPLAEIIKIKSENDLVNKGEEILDNFCFKFLDKTIKDLQKTILIDKKSMKAATSETLQNQLVDLAKCLFGNIVLKIAAKISRDEATRKMINENDTFIIKNILELRRVNHIKNCMNQILDLEIIENCESLNDYLRKSKDVLINNLLPHFELIVNSGATFKEELVNINSFKDIKYPSYIKLNKLIQDTGRSVQSSLNLMSKL